MASQRVTILKIGGLAGTRVWQKLTTEMDVTNVANRLLAHRGQFPVCYDVQWHDHHSMFDVFARWMQPPGIPQTVHREVSSGEVYAYRLPDEGRLLAHLTSADPDECDETRWYITHLRQAVEAWSHLVPQATLVVIRSVTDGGWSEEEVLASLEERPEWLDGG
jgi:hypothetical protein